MTLFPAARDAKKMHAGLLDVFDAGKVASTVCADSTS